MFGAFSELVLSLREASVAGDSAAGAKASDENKGENDKEMTSVRGQGSKDARESRDRDRSPRRGKTDNEPPAAGATASAVATSRG